LQDVPEIAQLIERYRFKNDGSGSLLPLSEEDIVNIIIDSRLGTFFSVVDTQRERLVGCVSVVEYGMPDDLEEFSSKQLLDGLYRILPEYLIRPHFRALKEGQTFDNGNIVELRSLAVSEEYRGLNLGSRLIRRSKVEAKARKFSELYSLVNHDVYPLFEREGFVSLQGRMPQKLYRDCQICPLRFACPEIPVVAYLATV